MKNVSYRIKKITSGKEIHILDDFLYEAIFIPEKNKHRRKRSSKNLSCRCMLQILGKKDDICYVAEISGKISRGGLVPDHG